MSENKTQNSLPTSPQGSSTQSQKLSQPETASQAPAVVGPPGLAPGQPGFHFAVGFQQLLQQQSHSYPPIEFMEYFREHGVPDAPSRIMKGVEKEQGHRHDMDRAASRLPVTRLQFGFAALVLCVGLAAASLAIGQPWAAVAFVGIPTASIIGIFVTNRLANGTPQQPNTQDSAQQKLPGV